MRRYAGRHLKRAIVIWATIPGQALAAERPSPQELRQALDDILASGYRLEAPLQVRVQEWLLEWLRRLSEQFGGLSETGPLAALPQWLSWVIFGVCIVLLGLLFWHMASRLRDVLAEKHSRPGVVSDTEQFTDPRELMVAAETAFDRAEYERAVRLLYRAVLRRLDRLDLLNDDPARTNWENVLALRAPDDDLRGAMAGLAHEIDDCVYGGQQASAMTWERARQFAEIAWRTEAKA